MLSVLFRPVVCQAKDWNGRTPLIHALQWKTEDIAALLNTDGKPLPSKEQVRIWKLEDRDTVQARLQQAWKKRRRSFEQLLVLWF